MLGNLVSSQSCNKFIYQRMVSIKIICRKNRMKNLVCVQWPCCQHRNIFPPWDWTRYRVTVVKPLVRNSRSVDPKYWCFRFSDLFCLLYRCMHGSHHLLLLCFEFGIAIFFQFLRFLQSFCRINLLFRWAQAFRLQHRHGATCCWR